MIASRDEIVDNESKKKKQKKNGIEFDDFSAPFSQKNSEKDLEGITPDRVKANLQDLIIPNDLTGDEVAITET